MGQAEGPPQTSWATMTWQVQWVKPHRRLWGRDEPVFGVLLCFVLFHLLVFFVLFCESMWRLCFLLNSFLFLCHQISVPCFLWRAHLFPSMRDTPKTTKTEMSSSCQKPVKELWVSNAEAAPPPWAPRAEISQSFLGFQTRPQDYWLQMIPCQHHLLHPSWKLYFLGTSLSVFSMLKRVRLQKVFKKPGYRASVQGWQTAALLLLTKGRSHRLFDSVCEEHAGHTAPGDNCVADMHMSQTEMLNSHSYRHRNTSSFFIWSNREYQN